MLDTALLPYAKFMIDTDKWLAAAPELKNPCTQNKLIERARLVERERVISRRELAACVEDWFNWNRGEFSPTTGEVLAHYAGRQSLRWRKTDRATEAEEAAWRDWLSGIPPRPQVITPSPIPAIRPAAPARILAPPPAPARVLTPPVTPNQAFKFEQLGLPGFEGVAVNKSKARRRH